MKIVFFGTPDFTLPILNNILKSDHEIIAIVTAPDKERGRGRNISSTPVKKFAIEHNILCLQPESLKDDSFVDQLKKLEADLFVVVAFRILPRAVYNLPPKGTFNLHGSILPKYRGAAPIQWALINGDKETGVTTFFLEDKVDTGKMIFSEKIDIEPEDNFEILHDKLSLLGAEVVMKTIAAINNDSVQLQQQDDSLATPAPKITKEICQLDFNRDAETLHNLVRGLSPFPGAYFISNEKHYKVYKTKIDTTFNLEVGEIKETKNEIFIGCLEGVLEILEIQPEGRKRMTTAEFLRGYSLTSS